MLEFRVQFRWEDPMPSIQNQPSTELVGDRHHCSSAATHFAASRPTHFHCDPNLPRLTFFFSLLRSVLPNPAKRQRGFLAWTAKLQNYFFQFQNFLKNHWFVCGSTAIVWYYRCTLATSTKLFAICYKYFVKRTSNQSVTNGQKLTQLYKLWKGA